MTDRIHADALNLKKLIREAEALSDESMIALARLRQAMLAARQNPAVEVSTGQRALMRLAQAETHAMSLSTSLLRVHDEMSRIARETMTDDQNIPTEVEPSALGFQAEATPGRAADPVAA